MPTALEGVNWTELRNIYLSSPNLSIRELATRFKLSIPTVQKRCVREGWKRERDSIEKNRAEVVARVSNAVVEKVSNKAADAIASHLQSILTSGNGFLSKLSANLEQASLPAVRNHQTAMMSLKMLSETDDLIRRAHGLADPTSRIDITTGGLPMHEKALSILEACTKLVKDGKATTVDVDVDGLVKRMEEDGKGVDSK